jgi:hypothetical protein
MPNLNWPIWLLWPQLGWPYRLFWIILTLVGVYVVASVIATVVRLRSTAAAQLSLPALYARTAKLGHLITAAFYLFGLVFFLSLPTATFTLGDGRDSPIMQILGQFLTHFAFAANVFFVLLVLYCLHWYVAARVARAHHRASKS